MHFDAEPLRLSILLAAAALGCWMPWNLSHAQQATDLEIVLAAPIVPLQDPDTDEALAEDSEALDDSESLPTLPETTVTPPVGGSSPRSSPTPAAGNAPVPVPAQFGGQTSAASGSNLLGQPLPPGTVVTATRSAQPAGRVGSSLTVISREAIRNSGQTSVADVLRSVPGLDVVSQGGPGQQTSVFMRGASSNQTKVLLDGMPINDPGAPGRAFDFSFLSVDEIDRVEVLRGPQSTLYGSDAIGGVINIITRRGGTPGTTVSVEGGSFSTSRTRVHTSGGNERVYYSLGGSYYDTNGFSAAALPPGNREADFYRNGTISGRLGWNATENLTFDLVARHHDSDTGTDGFPPPTFTLQDDDSSLEQIATFVRGQASLEMFDGLWTHRLGSGYTQYERYVFSDFGGIFYGRTGRLDYQNDLLLTEHDDCRWLVSSGVAFLEEVARNDSVADARQGNLGGFVQSSLDINERLFLTGGGRWDDYSRAGDAFTYRFTSRYEVTTTTALHGAIGTGFRAPALDELLGLVGNPLLRPEQSKGWEAGLQQRVLDERLTLDATYFRNDFEDLVVFVFDPMSPLPFGGQLENFNQALASGVEFTSLLALTEQSTLFANYTFTDTRDLATGEPLLRRPRDKWAMGISRTWPENRANVTLQGLYVGERADFGTVLDDYWLVNLAGWYRLSETCRVFGRVDNLLDQDYQPVAGYQGTPGSVHAGLEARY